MSLGKTAINAVLCAAVAVFLCAGSCVSIAMAAAPVPQKKDNLAIIEQQLENTRQEKKQLERKSEAAKKQISDIQTQLVDLAREVQANERDLTLIEGELDRLAGIESHLMGVMSRNRNALGELVTGLQRLARIPPEAMLLRPGSPIDNARAAMLLKAAMKQINEQVATLKEQLAELADTRKRLSEQRDIATQIQTSLVAKQDEMNGLLAVRKQFLDRTEAERKHKENEVRELARQARDVEDLIARLEEQKKREAEERKRMAALAAKGPPALRPQGTEAAPTPRQKPDAPKMAAAMPSDTGERFMPMAGTVTIGYGDEDLLGAESRGMTVSGRPGATVVSPMGGVVRFAGPFRHFQHILIIEHPGGYHSLIAGLARINAEVGQQVAAGEPVGALGKPPEWDTNLYYELRKNGQPVDPAPVVAANKS